MKRSTLLHRLSLRAWLLRSLSLALACGTAACGDVNFNPTQPTTPWGSNAGLFRTLTIQGSLSAAGGLCLEATVLFDGEELAGARSECADGGGCATLELSATARAAAGKHTVSFQIVRQSAETVGYLADGAVVIRRDGLPFVLTLPLESQAEALRAGESLVFELEIID